MNPAPRYVHVHAPHGLFVARLSHALEHGVKMFVFEQLDRELQPHRRAVVPAELIAQGWWFEDATEAEVRLAAPGHEVGLADILAAVAAAWRVTPEQLRSKSRRQEIVVPRQVFHHLARALTERSAAEIAQFSGTAPDTDHSIVWHSLRVVAERMATEPEFLRQVELLAATLRRPALVTLTEEAA